MAVLNIADLDNLILSRMNISDFMRLVTVNKYTRHIITSLPIYSELRIIKNAISTGDPMDNIRMYYKYGTLNILQNLYVNNKIFSGYGTMTFAARFGHAHILDWLVTINEFYLSKVILSDVDVNIIEWLNTNLHQANISYLKNEFKIDFIISPNRNPEYMIFVKEIQSLFNYFNIEEIHEESGIICNGITCKKLTIKFRFEHGENDYELHICDLCGLYAPKFSNMKYECRLCQNITKISILIIPYEFKSIIEKLLSMNIMCYFKTSKINVDNVLSL